MKLSILVFALILTLAYQFDTWGQEPTESVPKVEEHSQTVADARALGRAFRTSAERVLPSVVTIIAHPKRENPVGSILDAVRRPDRDPSDSLGSGVIVSADGYILTNHHVIEDAEEIIVEMNNGRRFQAVNSMSDPTFDLGVVKVEADSPFPFAELGLSEELYVGDWVLAIGSPFGLEASVSAGIISSKRGHERLSELVSGQFLQTDAVINPGNSGGPLIDLNGRVIGINTAITSRTGGYQGIGFAIPIERASWIKDELLQFGRVRTGFAGVRTAELTYDDMVALKLPDQTGCLVKVVTPGYPAALSGLQPNDVITQFNGRSIRYFSDFAEAVQRSQVGEPLGLTIVRQGNPVELKITLIERPFK
ncbi:MAG: trypsin-like peptidase domain-containing protein [Planctomycetales bacterium]|nr:trypsin-like peptidase domain-containing protein [Planctomycetales bacterium]